MEEELGRLILERVQAELLAVRLQELSEQLFERITELEALLGQRQASRQKVRELDAANQKLRRMLRRRRAWVLALVRKLREVRLD